MAIGDGAIRERLLRDAVLAGDEVAWRAWYEETYAPLEAYVLWRCGRLRDLADDVLQETWLTAVRLLRRFDPAAGNFLNWLRGIAANVVRNHVRQWQRGQRRRSNLPAELAGDSQASAAEQHERSQQIAVALAALPERYEGVLRAKYLDQMSLAEIAAAWGESIKAVESLLTRARAAFRDAYALKEPDHATG
jgi:RNA polymerase sigma-70 factor, ECF subfamily